MVSKTPWRPDHAEDMIFACSDSRFRDHIDEMTNGHLDIEAADTIAIPGGPVCLTSSYAGSEIFRAQARLLIELHNIRRVIGISHDNCGWYQSTYSDQTENFIKEIQQCHLREFELAILEINPELQVLRFFAQPENGTVHFYPVT